MPTPKLKDWADKVKARDGKCVHCGETEDLHAHHIKPKSTHRDLILDVANGKTLCYRCHKAEHERNRPIRIRSNRPQRRVLNKLVLELQERIKCLLAENRKLRHDANVCKRGACESALALTKKYQHLY